MIKKAARLILIPCVIVAAVISYPASATEPNSREYLLKAAFIFNIAKFVEWPPGSFDNEKAPLVFYVLGKDPFGYTISTIEGKIVQGRILVVKRTEKLDDLRACQMVFVSSSEMNRLPQVFQLLKDARVLTIGDMPNFAQNGGMINLVTAENKISMEINVAEAEKAKLQISSKLLKLARIVNE